MFDFIIRNGRIVTAAEILPAGLDLGVKDGKIAYIGTALPETNLSDVIDAEGAFITPGGVDSHVHIDQGNHLATDTWEDGTKSAIAGGNTTVLPFAEQSRKEESLYPAVQRYHQKATGHAYCDYGFHLILTNPTTHILQEELKDFVENKGITSVKLYMTYEPLKLNDAELLDVMMQTRKLGMTTMIHAENNDMIKMIINRLEEKQNTEAFHHAVARPQLAEAEATYRVISLAELTDTPILIVHMSAEAAVRHVREAQTQLLPVYAETCPHYLYLRSEHLGKSNFEGAKYVCAPPLRHAEEDLEAMWQAIKNGTFNTFSSDHCPDKFEHPCGKKKGLHDDGKVCFKDIPNGLPGIETRMPLLFSQAGDESHHRLSLPRFVQLTSTTPAALYGLSGRKGSLVPGMDADIVIWYPQNHDFGEESPGLTIRNENLHHSADYTPFEGIKVSNWPRKVFLRGKLAWDRDGEGVVADKNAGQFIKRGTSSLISGRRKMTPKGMFEGETALWRD